MMYLLFCVVFHTMLRAYGVPISLSTRPACLPACLLACGARPRVLERNRVAKAGAAACKHCGGAGGGSEWAQAFAAALCDVFDCPTMVRREVSFSRLFRELLVQ